MAAVVNIVNEPTLADLAETANREHEAVAVACAEAVAHAIRAGEALLAAHDLCEHGDWLGWVKAHFAGSTALASAYMRIARYKDIVAECETFAEARLYLRGLPPVNDAAPPGHGDELREQAQALVAEGATGNEAAKMLGVSGHSVRRWTDTDLAQRQRERSREQQRERKRERSAQRKEAEQRRVKRLATSRGGGISEAYSLAERMQDALGRAEREATTPEGKAALVDAGRHYRQMRDDIVRALGAA